MMPRALAVILALAVSASAAGKKWRSADDAYIAGDFSASLRLNNDLLIFPFILENYGSMIGKARTLIQMGFYEEASTMMRRLERYNDNDATGSSQLFAQVRPSDGTKAVGVFLDPRGKENFKRFSYRLAQDNPAWPFAFHVLGQYGLAADDPHAMRLAGEKIRALPQRNPSFDATPLRWFDKRVQELEAETPAAAEAGAPGQSPHQPLTAPPGYEGRAFRTADTAEAFRRGAGRFTLLLPLCFALGLAAVALMGWSVDAPAAPWGEALTGQDLAAARAAKAAYLWIVPLVTGADIIGRLPISWDDHPWLGLMLAPPTWAAVQALTWRLCRAMGYSQTRAALHAFFSPFLYLLQFILLLRRHAERTDAETQLLAHDLSRRARELSAQLPLEGFALRWVWQTSGQQPHIVVADVSAFTGDETVWLDGNLVSRERSYSLRKERSFVIDGTQARLVMRLSPALLPRCELYLGEELLERA